MISLIRAAWQDNLRVPMFVGLSTDGYPNNSPALINGARIYHMDTGVEYEYSASDREWYEVEDGSDIISGYYYNGQFYRDEQHTQLLTPKEGRFYYDKEKKIIYLYNGTNYVDVQTVQVGRFLSGWDSTTGLPMSDPTTMPYTYVTGDYYMISDVGDVNYRPTGTIYDGTASTVVETEIVDVNDFYFFDGASWLLLENVARVDDVQIDGVSIVADGIAQIPTATSDTKGVVQLTVIQANTNTTVNTYSVPQLTATQVLQVYNAVVAGKTAIVVDATGDYQFNVLSAYTDDDVIYIVFDYMEKMVLKYDGAGNITFVTLAQFAIIDLGSTQYSYHDYVLPAISVSTCRQIYANDVAGIFQILRWTFMGSESNFRVVSSDKIVENYSFDLLVHNRYHCSYTWTDETTGMVNPEVDSLEVDDVTIDKNTNGELQIKDGAITNVKVNSALKATSISTTPSNDKFVTEQALYNYIASGNAGYPRALDNIDLNTVISTGFYSCNVCTNRPTENNGAMIVIRNTVNTNTLVQIYFSYAADEMWVRHRDNSIWKSWVKVTKSTDIGTMAVLYDAVQTLTENQKAQARENINAAAPDGYYGESGGVFQFATNFLGKNAPTAAKDLVFRPTASNFSGSGWSADSIGGQTATVEKIKGKTLVWNQQMKVDFMDASKWNCYSGTATFSNNEVSVIGAVGRNGIKIKNSFDELTLIAGHKYFVTFDYKASVDIQVFAVGMITLSAKDNWFTYSAILNRADTQLYVNVDAFPVITGTVGDFSLRRINVIDLTQMFGAGNEPATVEEFRAMFPLDYYEYNPGELVSFNGTGLKTTGFNQLYPDGHIDVIAGLTYKIEGTYTSLKDSAGNDVTVTNGEFTPIANDTYTMVGGTCVHLKWSSVRDGETEPHWDSTLSLPIATYFPDGMKSAGTVYDELTKDKAIKRIGKIDLGSINYGYVDISMVFFNFETLPTNFKGTRNAIVKDYAVLQNETSARGMPNMTIEIRNGSTFYIKNTSYTDATAFKAAMSGVYLYYELAEPVETPISPELNLTYRCDDFGTEMLLPQNDDEPITAPMDADIVYQLDYEAQVRNNDSLNITKRSMDNYVDAFNESGLGTLTQTWNSGDKSYHYDLVKAETNLFAFGINATNYVPIMKKWFANHGASAMTDFSQLCDLWYEVTRTGWTGGTRFSQPNVSTLSTGTGIGDNASMVCTPASLTSVGRDDYASVPLFYTVDCNVTLDANGKPHVTAIDGVCGNFERYNPAKIVCAMQMTPFVKYTEDANYITMEYSDEWDKQGFTIWPDAINLDGTKRTWVVHTKYAMGDNYSSCSGQPIHTWDLSHNSQLTGIRTKWGNRYCGKTTADDAWIKWQVYIKYKALSPETVGLVGCTNYYNNTVRPALGEEDVTRVLLTNAQLNTFVVGSTVCVGSTSYGAKATLCSVVDRAIIESIETVEIEGTNYTALNLSVSTPFTTTTDLFVTSWMWQTGSLDDIAGFDGARVLNNSKYPFKIQGIECVVGCYEVLGDAILRYDNIDGSYYCRPYVCRDATKLTTSVSSDYTGTSYHAPVSPEASAWQYIQKLGHDTNRFEVMFPELAGSLASSSNLYRDALYNEHVTSSVLREWLSVGDLYYGGIAGVSCVAAYGGLSSSDWDVGARLSVTGNRGELTA